MEALQRALREETGIREFTLLSANPRMRAETADSPSYPGIPSEYLFYDFDVLVDPSEYTREGYREIQPDKTTYFLWTLAS